VSGIPTSRDKKSSTRSREERRRESCILILILICTLFFAYLLVLNPVYAGLFGLFFALFLTFMLLPRDQPPKELERLKRDTNRRAYVPPFGGGSGVLFLEDGGPTKPEKSDENY
jgi:hypothetical protein